MSSIAVYLRLHENSKKFGKKMRSCNYSGQLVTHLVYTVVIFSSYYHLWAYHDQIIYLEYASEKMLLMPDFQSDWMQFNQNRSVQTRFILPNYPKSVKLPKIRVRFEDGCLERFFKHHIVDKQSMKANVKSRLYEYLSDFA